MPGFGRTRPARFTQPDSIVPGAGDARAWDRYAYVKYNPIKYVDPSGKTNMLPPNKNVLLTDGGSRVFYEIDLNIKPNVLSPILFTQYDGRDTTNYYHISGFTDSGTPFNIVDIGDTPDTFQYQPYPAQMGLSAFIEVGGGLGNMGVLGGAELGRVGENEFLSVYCGHSYENVDFGSSVSFGLTFYFDADISDIEGYGEDYYFTFSILGFGGTITCSEGSYSIAYSPGTRLGIGSSESYKMLLYSIERK